MRRAGVGPFRSPTGCRTGNRDPAVLAGDVLELPGVAPVRRITVIQPEDRRGRVRRHVLDVRRVDRLLCSGRHEDLDSVVMVADGALVERALGA
jgi:hypothetical protein